MVPGAVIGSVAEREGRPMHRLRTRDRERATVLRDDIVERGFEVEVRLAGALAMVRVPYDLYMNGAWSHCGVDLFSLVRTDAGWRIASLVYSVEQPPACRRHPDGPPARAGDVTPPAAARRSPPPFAPPLRGRHAATARAR